MRKNLRLVALFLWIFSYAPSARAEEASAPPIPEASGFEVPSGSPDVTPQEKPSVQSETTPENPAPQQQSAPPPVAQSEASKERRPLVVTSTTDTSNYGLARQMQFALARLFEDSKYFTVKMSGFAFAGFSEMDVARAFESLSTEVTTFAYLENERIAVFIFDSQRPKEFIAVSESLAVSRDPNVMQTRIEDKLLSAFQQSIAAYKAGNYQPLPGVQVDSAIIQAEEQDEKIKRSIEARSLFRELSSVQEGRIYLGANLGMARFSAKNAAGSTVNISAFGGGSLTEYWRLEGGVNCFSYAMLYLDGRYIVPFTAKYINLGLSFGFGTVLGSVSPADGFDPDNFKTGSILAGPGLSLLIPVMGAQLRGEIKLYVGKGGSSIVMGNYGVSYSL